MKKNLTELVFILDRSGSMGGLEQDTTDGLENASKRFGYEKIRRMIEREKEQYGWEFLFLGANMDAAQEAARFGISSDRAVRFENDAQGVAVNYHVVSETVFPDAGGTLLRVYRRRVERTNRSRFPEAAS